MVWCGEATKRMVSSRTRERRRHRENELKRRNETVIVATETENMTSTYLSIDLFDLFIN